MARSFSDIKLNEVYLLQHNYEHKSSVLHHCEQNVLVSPRIVKDGKILVDRLDGSVCRGAGKVGNHCWLLSLKFYGKRWWFATAHPDLLGYKSAKEAAKKSKPPITDFFPHGYVNQLGVGSLVTTSGPFTLLVKTDYFGWKEIPNVYASRSETDFFYYVGVKKATFEKTKAETYGFTHGLRFGL